MNELKEKVSEVVEKIKTMPWREFIGLQFLALFAVVVIIIGGAVGLKELGDQDDVPEHPTEMWGKAESSKSSSGQSEMLAGANDGYVGPFTADLGNSKSPTVEGSQAGPITVDYVDSALPVDDDHPTPMPDKKNPTDDILNAKGPWEDYDIPWPDDNNRVSNGRITEPPIYD